MTDATRTGYDRQAVPDDPAALYADIEETRDRLGETVDELGHRLDVRARVKETAAGASHRVSETARYAGHRVSGLTRDHPVALAGGGVAVVAAAGAGVLAWRRWGR